MLVWSIGAHRFAWRARDALGVVRGPQMLVGAKASAAVANDVQLTVRQDHGSFLLRPDEYFSFQLYLTTVAYPFQAFLISPLFESSQSSTTASFQYPASRCTPYRIIACVFG